MFCGSSCARADPQPSQTASEPLSLDEEYAMQQAWEKDQDKCTFIVLDALATAEYVSPFVAERPCTTLDCLHRDEAERMVGDVNLFFNDSEDPHSAEVEVMIAEAAARGRGLGNGADLACAYQAHTDTMHRSRGCGADDALWCAAPARAALHSKDRSHKHAQPAPLCLSRLCKGQ